MLLCTFRSSKKKRKERNGAGKSVEEKKRKRSRKTVMMSVPFINYPNREYCAREN